MQLQTLIAEIERGIIKSCQLKTDHSANMEVHEVPELHGKLLDLYCYTPIMHLSMYSPT